MAETTKIRKRSEIPVEDTWALEDLYVTDEAWEQELATLAEDEKVLISYAGNLGNNAQTLYAYLEKTEAVNAKAELLGNYCMRKADQDTREAAYQAMVGKFMSVIVGLSAATSFETPEIMAIPEETLGYYGYRIERTEQAITLYAASPNGSMEAFVYLAEAFVTGYEDGCYLIFEDKDFLPIGSTIEVRG